MNLPFEVTPLLLHEETPGIFESLRAYQGVFFGLEEHLNRFFESAKTLGLKMPASRGEIRKRLWKSLEESSAKDAFIRLTLVGKEILVMVTQKKHPSRIYQGGVVVKTAPFHSPHPRAAFPEAKSNHYLKQIMATLDPEPEGNFEILFLSHEGYLTEARIGNFFIVKKGALLTPPGRGLLDGVTRRFVIKCAGLGKIPCEEIPLTRHDLFNADEAFLTNTSWEILPIREADGRKIGTRLPGPVTERLQRLFRREVQREIQKAKRGKD